MIRAQGIMDTWRDQDADSGLRLDHWLSLSSYRSLRMYRIGYRNTMWSVDLTEHGVRVATASDEHIDQAWGKALDALAEKEES